MEYRGRKHRVVIRFAGEDVAPDSVRASDLADFLLSWEKAIRETAIAKGVLSPDVGVDQVVVSLVDIGPGSDALGLALSYEGLVGYQTINHAVRDEDYTAIPAGAHDSLHHVDRLADRRGWSIVMEAAAELGVVEATISREHPVPAPKVITATGETVIYGRLIRVGGIAPKAKLRLADDTDLTIDLTEAMAVQLGSKERLYKDVGVEGVATWKVDNWQILSFKATRVMAYQPHLMDIDRAFQELARLSGGRWDDVDLDRYVDELRGRDVEAADALVDEDLG